MNESLAQSPSDALPPPRARTPQLARALALPALLAGALVAGAVGGIASRDLAPGVAAPAATAVPTAAPGTLSSSFADAAARVAPAVVRITTDQGLGSGFVYDAGGLILTNAHVVASAGTIEVTLSDGRTLPGQVLGADVGFDLAVVKVQASGLRAATLGDSTSLHVGDTVLAVGDPYGYDHTVTMGVVSALDRPVSEGQGSYAQPMIQTDAAINPGNSGGPLVDTAGNVVGITTLIAAPQGIPAQGLGFAVPSATAARIAPQLAASGRVTHSGQPWLGVNLRDGASGVTVVSVVAGNAAERAGLLAGDQIVSAGGRDIRTVDDLLGVLVRQRPGDTLDLGVRRGGSTLTLHVTLDEAPAR